MAAAMIPKIAAPQTMPMPKAAAVLMSELEAAVSAAAVPVCAGTAVPFPVSLVVPLVDVVVDWKSVLCSIIWTPNALIAPLTPFRVMMLDVVSPSVVATTSIVQLVFGRSETQTMVDSQKYDTGAVLQA